MNQETLRKRGRSINDFIADEEAPVYSWCDQNSIGEGAWRVVVVDGIAYTCLWRWTGTEWVEP